MTKQDRITTQATGFSELTWGVAVIAVAVVVADAADLVGLDAKVSKKNRGCCQKTFYCVFFCRRRRGRANGRGGT